MLSTEQFAELVALIQTTHDNGPKPEVRRAQRIAHPCRITITLGTNENHGAVRLVQLKDISARGVCFIHNEELPRGTVFVVKLEDPRGKCVSILSSVVHCRQVDKNTYQFGAEFTCVLGEEKKPVTLDSAEDLMRIRRSILR